MKKLLAVLIVLAFVAPVIPAMADDTLDLSGTMRVRAYTKTDHDFDSSDDDDQQYWDQRFRVQGAITPSDGVKGVFRLNMANNVWGVAGMDDGSSNEDKGGVDVDRAYLAINKGIVSLSAGLQSAALGNAVAYDAVHTGIVASIATPVTITLVYFKVDEDQTSTETAVDIRTDAGADGVWGTADDTITTVPVSVLGTDKTDETGYEDVDHYAINLGYAADNMSINVFYAMQVDGAPATASDPKVEPNCIGVQGKFAVGPVNINAELDIFGGDMDTGTSTIDFVGTQFFADLSMAMSDALTLGAHLVYSTGTDSADEVKLTYLTDDGSTVFSDYGAMNTLGISPLDYDIFDDGNGSGTMGAGLYAKFQAMEDLTLFGQILYATADEDKTGGLDNLILYNVSAKYTIVPNAHLSVQYGYFDLEANDTDTDPASTLGARLQIDF